MVTSVAKDEGKRFIGDVGVFIGEENESAASLVGFVSRDPGVEWLPTMETQDVHVVDKAGAIASDATTREAVCNFTCIQVEPAILAFALGVTEDGQVISVGGSNAIQRRFSLKLTGVVADGTIQTIEAPSVTSISNPAFTLNPGAHTTVSVSLKALDHADNTYMWRWTAGAGNVVATLDTNGVLTSVINLPSTYHKIASFVSGASDILSSMIGTAQVDGHKVTLQINSISEPINVADDDVVGDEFQLIGGNDFLMTSLSDWIQFQWDDGASEWNETKRYMD